MCTLTYRLTATGYEIFFNRDEQHRRDQALPPQMDRKLNALYPIDPVGKGTWLAVHQSGVSLALLNYYQAEKKNNTKQIKSRGEIILTLLSTPGNIVEALKVMILTYYQPFQLCVFLPGLSLSVSKVLFFQWDGKCLTELQQTIPITSSSVDYPEVYQARKNKFAQMVATSEPTSQQLINFHQSKQSSGKLSVQMSRSDAKTVSFSHICVGPEISFSYLDYLNKQQVRSAIRRIS